MSMETEAITFAKKYIMLQMVTRLDSGEFEFRAPTDEEFLAAMRRPEHLAKIVKDRFNHVPTYCRIARTAYGEFIFGQDGAAILRDVSPIVTTWIVFRDKALHVQFCLKKYHTPWLPWRAPWRKFFPYRDRALA